MEGAGQGDLAAFEQLVLRHQETVWRTAYRMLGCPAEAEDMAQEAFLRVFKARERYRPTAAFRTYLYRIVVRLCLDRLRKGRPFPAGGVLAHEGPLALDDSPSAEQRAVHAEQARAVRRAISRLPPKQRAAVVLRYYEGQSYREIAAAMDTSAKAVERLLARARETLEALLGDFFRE